MTTGGTLRHAIFHSILSSDKSCVDKHCITDIQYIIIRTQIYIVVVVCLLVVESMKAVQSDYAASAIEISWVSSARFTNDQLILINRAALVCTVYINTHTYMYILRKIFIFTYNFFFKYTVYMYVCVFTYT